MQTKPKSRRLACVMLAVGLLTSSYSAAYSQETAESFDRAMAKIEKNRRVRSAVLISNFGPQMATTVMVKYRKEKEALQRRRTEICLSRHGNYDPSDDTYETRDGGRRRCE